MMVEPELVSKYRKVVRLAEKGEGGEATSASKRAASMREKYPGIEEAAAKADRADRVKEQMRDWGMDPEAASGFDDSSFFDMVDKIMETQEKGADATWSEKAFSRAVSWAVETLGKSGALRATEPFEKPEPPKRAKRDSIERQVYEDVDVFEAFASEEDDGVEIITLNFELPADLWDRVVRSKQGAVTLLKFLDKMVLDGVADEEDDEDEDDD